MKKQLGNLVGGFIIQLIGVKIEERKRLIEAWKYSGYGYKKKLSNYSFNGLIKLAIVGDLK